MAKNTSFGAAPAGIYICTLVWQLNYLCGVIGAASSRREKENRGSYFLAVTSYYYARRSRGYKGGNGVVVVTRFNRLKERIRAATRPKWIWKKKKKEKEKGGKEGRREGRKVFRLSSHRENRLVSKTLLARIIKPKRLIMKVLR